MHKISKMIQCLESDILNSNNILVECSEGRNHRFVDELLIAWVPGPKSPGLYPVATHPPRPRVWAFRAYYYATRGHVVAMLSCGHAVAMQAVW